MWEYVDVFHFITRLEFNVLEGEVYEVKGYELDIK